MRWVYLSPHLDDIVLSCGGMVWQQVQAGAQVEIWTIFSGDAPAGELAPFARELHERWGTGPQASAVRRAEDAAACQSLGARHLHLNYPDCIYRVRADGSPLIASNQDLFETPLQTQQALIDELAARLAESLPGRARLACPLSIGGHMDHRVLRAAADQLGRRLHFFADYPYLVTHQVNLRDWLQLGWRKRSQPVSEEGLHAWQAAVACHQSQISTFWGGLAEMRADIEAYWRGGGGNAFYVRKGISPRT